MSSAAAKAPQTSTKTATALPPAPGDEGSTDSVPSHWDDLGTFVRYLERRGELRRITQELDPVLEISALAQRAVRAGGPALLFERVKGSRFPLLINSYATRRRVSWALGVPDLDEHARAIFDLVRSQPPVGLMDKVRMLPKLARIAAATPKTVRNAPCQEVVETDIDLGKLPVLTTWPEDGGPYITLPMVITRDPDKGTRNVGCYRMQVYDARTTGMHWQLHKTGRRHMRRYKELGQSRMPVAVALGGDPALPYAATAPLPDGIDEFLFAGFLRRKPVEMVRCKTIDLEVPASADFVLEGYVDVNEPLQELSSDRLIMAVAQIVYTASTVDGVSSVLITVDGASSQWPAGNGELQGEPLSVYDFPGLEPSSQPAYPGIPPPEGGS